MCGVIGVILLADFFNGTAVADIWRPIQLRTGNGLVILTVFSAVACFAEFAPTEAAVFCFVWTDILMQAL